MNNPQACRIGPGTQEPINTGELLLQLELCLVVVALPEPSSFSVFGRVKHQTTGPGGQSQRRARQGGRVFSNSAS